MSWKSMQKQHKRRKNKNVLNLKVNSELFLNGNSKTKQYKTDLRSVEKYSTQPFLKKKFITMTLPH